MMSRVHFVMAAVAVSVLCLLAVSPVHAVRFQYLPGTHHTARSCEQFDTGNSWTPSNLDTIERPIPEGEYIECLSNDCMGIRCSEFVTLSSIPEWARAMPVQEVTVRLLGGEDIYNDTMIPCPSTCATQADFQLRLDSAPVGSAGTISINGFQFTEHEPFGGVHPAPDPPVWGQLNAENSLFTPYSLSAEDITSSDFELEVMITRLRPNPYQIHAVRFGYRLWKDVDVTGVTPDTALAGEKITVAGTGFFQGFIKCRFGDIDSNDIVDGTLDVGETNVECIVPDLSLLDGDWVVELSFDNGATYTDNNKAFSFDSGEVFAGVSKDAAVKLSFGLVVALVAGGVIIVGAFVLGSYRLAVQSGVVGFDELDDIEDTDDSGKGERRKSKERKVNAVAATFAVSRARMSIRQDDTEMRKLIRSNTLSVSADPSRSIVEVVKNVDAAPPVLVRAIQYIEKEAVKLEGIFRISGSKDEVLKLMQQSKSKPRSVKFAKHDPHAVAGWIKLHFRKRAESVVPDPVVQLFQSKYKSSSMMETAFALKDAIRALPQRDRVELELICRLASKVTDNAKTTKMTLDNMTMVLGPSVIHSSNLQVSFSLMSMLIRLSGLIFGDDSELSQVSDAAMSALMQPATELQVPTPDQAQQAGLTVPDVPVQRSRSPKRPAPSPPPGEMLANVLAGSQSGRSPHSSDNSPLAGNSPSNYGAGVLHGGRGDRPRNASAPGPRRPHPRG